jgi:hypothetical protein
MTTAITGSSSIIILFHFAHKLLSSPLRTGKGEEKKLS